ncbi:hypothetical protein KAR48_16935 [bacterium]|nr:hypothetical protein [bacterium]
MIKDNASLILMGWHELVSLFFYHGHPYIMGLCGSDYFGARYYDPSL